VSEGAPTSHTPFRDVSVTAQMAQDALQRACPICGTRPESSRAKFCSHRCQMVAFRRRQGHQRLARELASPDLSKPTREHVVYECAECDTRYLGEQRCPTCNLFARRLGPGGYCPGCGDIVTVDELLGL
jgi:endogenous inhibitor of DNA gyrase (YacG/DUF329 family)